MSDLYSLVEPTSITSETKITHFTTCWQAAEWQSRGTDEERHSAILGGNQEIVE